MITNSSEILCAGIKGFMCPASVDTIFDKIGGVMARIYGSEQTWYHYRLEKLDTFIKYIFI